MRGPHPQRRGQQAQRHHQHGADQRDVAERKRQLQRCDIGKTRGRGPAGIDVAERPGDRDQDCQRRGGRDRLMDRPAVEGHQQVRKQSAAYAHQGGEDAYEEAVDFHQEPLREIVAELPGRTRQQQAGGGRPGHGDEHDLEQPLRRVTRGDAAGDHASQHRQPPRLEDFGVDRAPEVMRPPGANRGRDDDGKRGADTQRHPHLQRHACKSEAFVEHRDQDRAAANAEHACEKTGERADRHQQ